MEISAALFREKGVLPMPSYHPIQMSLQGEKTKLEVFWIPSV